MKISKCFFGSAVKLRGGMENMVDSERHNVTMTFAQGVLTIIDNTHKHQPTCVFTTNIKYFHPEIEPLVVQGEIEVEPEMAPKLKRIKK